MWKNKCVMLSANLFVIICQEINRSSLFPTALAPVVSYDSSPDLVFEYYEASVARQPHFYSLGSLFIGSHLPCPAGWNFQTPTTWLPAGFSQWQALEDQKAGWEEKSVHFLPSLQTMETVPLGVTTSPATSTAIPAPTYQEVSPKFLPAQCRNLPHPGPTHLPPQFYHLLLLSFQTRVEGSCCFLFPYGCIPSPSSVHFFFFFFCHTSQLVGS